MITALLGYDLQQGFYLAYKYTKEISIEYPGLQVDEPTTPLHQISPKYNGYGKPMLSYF